MVTFEIARRLAERGDSVEWFSASFSGAPAEEIMHGVRLVRAGQQWTVHWHAYRRYRHSLARSFDVVVDQINTIPFFTPLWSTVPIVMFIHQLAREVWWYEAPFPFSVAGFLAEPIYLRLYRRIPVVTVSASTSHDLRALGFTSPIEIIPEGVNSTPGEPCTKEVEPTFVYVGRLAPSKRVEHILRAFTDFQHRTGRGALWIVGTGSESYQASLLKTARSLGISGSVTFFGKVSEPEKRQRMARSHALLLASVREGWGLVVTEANASGTPAIVYDVPGLRDSVANNRTGLVVSPDPRQMTNAMQLLWNDEALYRTVASEALKSIRNLSYEASTDAMRAAMRMAVNEQATPQDHNSTRPNGD